MAEGGGGGDPPSSFLHRMRMEMTARLEKRARTCSEPPDLSLSDTSSSNTLPAPASSGAPRPLEPGLQVGIERPESRINSLAHLVSEAVKRREPFTALNHMAKMSNFDKGFEKFVFKRAQREADLGCRTFNEPGPTSFTKADLEGFQPENYYIRLFSTFPTLMTPMIAVAASGSFEDGTLELPTTTAKHGPRGGFVDLRTMLTLTGSRLLHSRHPQQVNYVAKLTSLHNAVKCLPGKEQAQANRLGDSYSKRESLTLLAGATKSFDSPFLAIRDAVQSLYTSPLSNRSRQALALKKEIRGCSFFIDNVGMPIVSRFNTGLKNANFFKQMTMVIGAENRIPTAHIPDDPMISPYDVDFFLSPRGLDVIGNWMEVVVGKILTTYCTSLRKYKKYIKLPSVTFADKMASKSKVFVLDVMEQDPATNHGATQVCLNLMDYVATIGDDKEKMVMIGGDQGVAERFRSCILSRTEEKKGQRLSALLCQPMDFHAMKTLDLPGEIQTPGSVSQVKEAFSHRQADRDVHNFYANESLLKVVTATNLLDWMRHLTGVDFMESSAEGLFEMTEQEFLILVRRLLSSVNMLPWIWSKGPDGEFADDQFLQHRLDLIFYGIHYQARALCVQYGDGIANNFFWRSDLYFFNLHKKYKYRMESTEKSAAAQGVHGRAMALNTTFNCFINDQGCRNTNKAADLKVEHVNGAFKVRAASLKGNVTSRSLSLMSRSMDLGKELDEKMNVRYLGGVEEAERRKKKRVESFQTQVVCGVQAMKDAGTLNYVPGRRYEVRLKRKGKVGGVREERQSGVPVSFERLNSFLQDRRRDLQDYVRETREPGANNKEVVAEVRDEEDAIDEEMEMGPSMNLESDIEEELSNAEEYESD